MAYENIRLRYPNMAVKDGEFYMLDHSWDAMLQKTDDGDTAFSYPTSVDLTKHIVLDEFTAASGSRPASEHWSYTSVSGVNNKMRFEGTGSVGSMTSRHALNGDFSVQIDFDIVAFIGSVNSWTFYLQVRNASSTQIVKWERRHFGEHRYYASYYSGGWSTPVYSSIVTHMSGKLRMRRTSNTFNVDYWINGAWSNFHSMNLAFDGVMYVDIVASTWDYYPFIIIDTDNYLAETYPTGITELEYDGVNFWSLQTFGNNVGVLIRKWRLENNICELKDYFQYDAYQSTAFTVEHYHATLSSGVLNGENTILISDYSTVISGGSILSLGPNINNESETAVVSTISGSYVTLSSGIQYDYDFLDPINFYNNIWLFNSSSTGHLLKIDAYTKNVLAVYADTEYDNITACTFARVEGVFVNDVDALIYVKSSNLKVLNINDRSNFGVMAIDSVKIDGITIIPIYSLSIDGNNIYRLQLDANYFGSNYTWSTYNYVLSTIRRFITTISVSSYPTILPNNGVNVSTITALINDQYGDGAVFKPVFYTDTDPVGFVTINPAYTDPVFATGQSISYYKAGITPSTVTIEGTVTQFD